MKFFISFPILHGSYYYLQTLSTLINNNWESTIKSKIFLPILFLLILSLLLADSKATFAGSISHPIDENKVSFLQPKPPAYYPEIFPDGSGGIFACWHVEQNQNMWQILAQRFDVSGNSLWSNDGITIAESNTYQWYPQGVSDGSGGAIIVWQNYRPRPSTDITHPFDVNAQRLDQAGNPLWGPAGVKIAVGFGLGGPLYEIIPDGKAGIITVWGASFSESGRNALYAPDNYRIYAQRVNGSGELLWAEGGVAVATGEPREAGVWFECVSDGAQGIIILWEIRYLNERGYYDSSSVYAQRVDASGQSLWGQEGILIFSDLGMASLDNAKIVADSAGGAIIVGRNRRTPVVKAQRIDSQGKFLWPDSGVVVFSGIESANNALSVSTDASGGAIITCIDESVKIYAQKLDSSGQTLLGDNGVIMGKALDYYDNPSEYQMISDGMGGVVLCWQYYHKILGGLIPGTNFDLFIQRLDSAGDTPWGKNGAMIANISDNGGKMNERIRITSEPNGTANIILWKYPNYGASPQFCFLPISDITDVQNSNKPNYWLVAGIILSCLAIGGFIYFYARRKSK